MIEIHCIISDLVMTLQTFAPTSLITSSYLPTWRGKAMKWPLQLLSLLLV